MRADPDANLMGVMALYGATMLSIQLFEMTLATYAQTLDHKPTARTTRTSPERSRILLARSARRSFTRFRKDTAASHMRAVEHHLPEELRKKTRDLITARNELAHRFLRQQIDMSSEAPRRFKSGTAARLLAIHLESSEVTKQIARLETETRAAWPPADPVTAEQASFIEDVSAWIVWNEVPSWARKRT